MKINVVICFFLQFIHHCIGQFLILGSIFFTRKNTVQILACFPAKRTVAVLKFVPSNYLYNNDCSRHFLNFQVSSKLYCALDSHIFSCMDSRRDQSRFAWLFPADNRRRKGKFTISNADKAVDALSRCRAKTADIYCITHSFILSIW